MSIKTRLMVFPKQREFRGNILTEKKPPIYKTIVVFPIIKIMAFFAQRYIALHSSHDLLYTSTDKPFNYLKYTSWRLAGCVTVRKLCAVFPRSI